MSNVIHLTIQATLGLKSKYLYRYHDKQTMSLPGRTGYSIRPCVTGFLGVVAAVDALVISISQAIPIVFTHCYSV